MYKKIPFVILSILIILMCSLWEYNVGYKNYTDKALDVDAENGTSSKSTEKKTAYITFDDGPSNLTDKVLDILEENDVHATFFLIGNQINNNTKHTLERLIKNGNQIGAHTYSHEANAIYVSADSYYNDIMQAEKTIIMNTGVAPLVYRFPWGSSNAYIKPYRKEIIGRLAVKGLNYCDWNVSGEDSVGHPSASQIIANVKSNYSKYNEPVILLHDSAGNKQTVEALPSIIKMYKEAGYDFGTISERSKIYQWKLN